MAGNKSRPTVAITIGDPAGIGPEIVLKSLRNNEILEKCIPLIIGNMEILQKCIDSLGLNDINIVSIDDPKKAKGELFKCEMIHVYTDGTTRIRPGTVSASGGNAADAYIQKVCELAEKGLIDAISTAPINKESLRAAGIDSIGHTELLAKYLNTDNPLTMFVIENMRIFFLSRHLSLRNAIEYITEKRLYDMIKRVNSTMIDFGFPTPKIAVAALNPHASDGGQFGDEEGLVITPAIKKAEAEGVDVAGPIGADSVFHQALEGKYDCVISLYHDQGHIASKTRDFFRTVTATLGLPILRTSVDHGTGFDIAWQGKASSVSMEAAILTACDFIKRMKRYK